MRLRFKNRENIDSFSLFSKFVKHSITMTSHGRVKWPGYSQQLFALFVPLLLEIIQHISDYKYIRSNTQLHYTSFLPSVVRDWNELPHIRNAPSISAIKRSLNSTINCVPLFYLDGKRISQIYHVRQRMDCSFLNQHLF